MGHSLLRTARSPILAEARDFVTGLYDARGGMLEQTEYIPILAFAISPALKHLIAYFEGDIHPGDIFLHNDPFTGGNQPTDVKVCKPIFHEKELIAWAAINAHQADVGGSVAGGYNPEAREIWQECLRITPVKIYDRGKVRRDVWDLIFGNIRFEIVAQDILAAIGGCNVGERQLQRLIERYSYATFRHHVDELIGRTKSMMANEIRKIPPGVYHGVCYAYDDGIRPDSKMRIEVTVKVDAESISFDFTGTDPQTPGFVNAPYSSTASAVLLTFLMLINPDVPHNEGLLKRIKIYVPEGTFLNARYPAATTFGNHLSDQISSAIFSAMAKAIPERISAAWCPKFSGTVVGYDPRHQRPYVDILFISSKGGSGATYGVDGYDCARRRWGDDFTLTFLTNMILLPSDRSWLEIPCRRAVADASRGAEKLSSTIRSFSAADQRRRRPVSTISRRLIWRASVRSSIPTISYMPDNSTRRPIPSGYHANLTAEIWVPAVVDFQLLPDMGSDVSPFFHPPISRVLASFEP